MIRDDDLFKTLVAPLPAGSVLTSVMDCCHSGKLFLASQWSKCSFLKSASPKRWRCDFTGYKSVFAKASSLFIDVLALRMQLRTSRNTSQLLMLARPPAFGCICSLFFDTHLFCTYSLSSHDSSLGPSASPRFAPFSVVPRLLPLSYLLRRTFLPADALSIISFRRRTSLSMINLDTIVYHSYRYGFGSSL